MQDISNRNKLFCEEYVKNGYNATQAYKLVYGQEDDLKAAISGSQLLKKPRVQTYLAQVEGSFRVAGFKAGINKDVIAKLLFKMMNADKVDGSADWTARHNAILDFTRLTGDLNEKKTVEAPKEDPKDKEVVDVKNMTFQELLDKKNAIMKTL